MTWGDPSRKTNPGEIVLLILITLGLIASPFLPFSFVTKSPSLCVFCAIGFTKCPGCGMSRAILSLLQGNPTKAVHYNWKVLFVAPILCLMYVELARRCLKLKPLIPNL